MVWLPAADIVIGGQDIVDQLGQVNAVVKLVVDGHTMSIPVNVLHDGWGPLVALLDVQ